ncbi:MAG TPA: bifunctional (p)ppGpp synthetase/guanosine-3',5'-bis(diphosphate) 3'-pyrophosphohydrolase [Myxococcales bacterium]|nr:bifunctional (p)ppGpp synthetase/guanosine-3',5'-bis(diphosphate) 3'-pyrophosphohydrolase [Myxococcales bacterium]
MSELDQILSKVESYHKGADLDLIKKAHVFAATSHDGQFRKSGEPYITHPIAVADLIADLKLDTSSVCAALLHDTVEDTSAELTDLKVLFSEEIADLVDGVTKLGKLEFRSKADRQAESFRKMLIAMSKDIRVILVKLADRLHNMRTLGHKEGDGALRIARETMDIYAPLANRLGIQSFKTELEDLAFRYLNPDAYAFIRGKVNEKRTEREQYISEVIEYLQKAMDEVGIKCEIKGRPKHFYSIHRKMQVQEIEFEQVYDAIAFRILVDDLKSCYEALGVIHTKWRPVPGRFKDYIALPKPNRYQSLHTSVLGPRHRRMEVQIRSYEMDSIAEGGVAAHWKYKDGGSLSDQDQQRFEWLKQLLEWHQEHDDPTDFLEMVKVDLFTAEVYVFTPNGDLKVLPKGSTPIDFAYAIHTEVGDHCHGATINGVMVALDYKLHSGDTCSIVTRNNQRPNMDWLNIVKTARAKSKIRQHIRVEQRERSRTVGREILDKGLRKFRKSYNKEVKSGRLELLAKEHFSLNTAEDLCVLVGYGKITVDAVVNQIVPEEDRSTYRRRPEGRITRAIRDFVSGARSGIVVDGLEDVVVRYSRCCNPVPGDSVIGFVTRGRGVAVHTQDCRHILDADPDRRIEVNWDAQIQHQHPLTITVISTNSPGILASISQALCDHNINISQANCITETTRAVNTFQVLVENSEQLKGAMRTIERINGVHSVERVRT